MNEFELEKVNIRMVPDAPMYSQTAISGPEDAVYMVADLLKDMDRECVCVINVNAANRPINVNVVSIGAVNYAVCHPADIFKAAVLSNATGMLLVHNHPSGNVNPSKDDIKVTDRMTKASEIMGINLLDMSLWIRHLQNTTALRQTKSVHITGERKRTLMRKQ